MSAAGANRASPRARACCGACDAVEGRKRGGGESPFRPSQQCKSRNPRGGAQLLRRPAVNVGSRGTSALRSAGGWMDLCWCAMRSSGAWPPPRNVFVLGGVCRRSDGLIPVKQRGGHVWVCAGRGCVCVLWCVALPPPHTSPPRLHSDVIKPSRRAASTALRIRPFLSGFAWVRCVRLAPLAPDPRRYEWQ